MLDEDDVGEDEVLVDSAPKPAESKLDANSLEPRADKLTSSDVHHHQAMFVTDRGAFSSNDDRQHRDDDDDFSNINTSESQVDAKGAVCKQSDVGEGANDPDKCGPAATAAKCSDSAAVESSSSWEQPTHYDLENDPIINTDLQQFHNPQQHHQQQHHQHQQHSIIGTLKYIFSISHFL